MNEVEQIVQDVKEAAKGRTRFEGQKPCRDELLVAEVDRLRGEITRLLGEIAKEVEEQQKVIAAFTSDRDSLVREVYRLRGELSRCRLDCEHLNEMMRQHGYGQGSIDTFVAQCEDQDQQRDTLGMARALLLAGLEQARLGAPLPAVWVEAAEVLLNTRMTEQTHAKVPEDPQGTEDHRGQPAGSDAA